MKNTQDRQEEQSVRETGCQKMQAISGDEIVQATGKQIEEIVEIAQSAGSIAAAVQQHLEVITDSERAIIEFAVKFIRQANSSHTGTAFNNILI